MEIPSGRYLILGSTGLIGSHALLKLKDHPGTQVLAHYHRRSPEIFAPNITYTRADLRERGVHAVMMRSADYVIMCAGVLSASSVIAKDPVVPVMDNLIMTVHSLEAAWRAGVKKFIFLSSTTGYPPGVGEITEDRMFFGDPPDFHYPVGWMTRYLETMCRMFAEKLKHKMTVLVLRPTMVYGPHDNFDFGSCHFLPAFIRRVAERQKPIEVRGRGEESRDLVYGADVVDAVFAAIDSIIGWETFNISYGKSYTINELLRKIIEIDKFSDAEIVHLLGGPRSVVNRSVSNKKIFDILKFRPRTTIEEGLVKTIDWYKDHFSTARRSGEGEVGYV